MALPSFLEPDEDVRRFRRWLWCITAVALGLRLVRLGAQSLWIDEGMSLGWIGEIEANGLGSVLQNIHGPLHALALYGVSRLSMSEWCLRLPSVLAGTLAVPALALLVRRLWGARPALVAAALAAVSPFGLYYSQEVRNYAFTLLFASLTGVAALAFVRAPRLRTALALGACELLGIASNLNGLFFACGLQVWLLAMLRQRPRALMLWAAVHVGLALVLVPHALHVQRQVGAERLVGVESSLDEAAPLRGATTLHAMSLPYTAYAFAAGYSLGPTLEELRRTPAAALAPRHLPELALIVFGFGVAFALGVARRASWPGATLLVVPAVVVTGCTLWLAAANIKPFNVRYLSVLQPGFLALVAQGLWGLGRRWRAAVGAAVAAASLWSCANYLFVPRYGRDDTRGVVEYVAAHAGPRDLVLHINLGFSLRYYDRLRQEVRLAEPGSGDSPEAARRYLDRVVGTAPVLWYLECRPEKLDPHGYLRDACAARATASTTHDFVGIRVHRFELAPRPLSGDETSPSGIESAPKSSHN